MGSLISPRYRLLHQAIQSRRNCCRAIILKGGLNGSAFEQPLLDRCLNGRGNYLDGIVWYVSDALLQFGFDSPARGRNDMQTSGKVFNDLEGKNVARGLGWVLRVHADFGGAKQTGVFLLLQESVENDALVVPSQLLEFVRDRTMAGNVQFPIRNAQLVPGMNHLFK